MKKPDLRSLVRVWKQHARQQQTHPMYRLALTRCAEDLDQLIARASEQARREQAP